MKKKRMFLLVIMILGLFSCFAEAHHRDFRYSPYAFCRENPSGLIPEYLHYSPYAFSHKNPSGLIPTWVRYSPYALSRKNPSGLIDVCWGNFYCFYPCLFPIEPRSQVVYQSFPDYPKLKRVREPREPIEPGEQDGLWIVYYYLESKGLEVDIVDGFCFRNQTVSTILLVRSKNLLIKYQNPKLEKSLENNPLWSGYKKRWSEKEKEYQSKGWKIGQVFG